MRIAKSLDLVLKGQAIYEKINLAFEMRLAAKSQQSKTEPVVLIQVIAGDYRGRPEEMSDSLGFLDSLYRLNDSR